MQFCVGSDEWQKCCLKYLALHKRILAVLKVCTNADTTVKDAYTIKSAWKFDTVKEKLVFSSRLPLRFHIAKLAAFSVDPDILISLYASAHHPYTILIAGEWMIFWLGEGSSGEVRSTDVAAILFLSHPYMYTVHVLCYCNVAITVEVSLKLTRAWCLIINCHGEFDAIRGKTVNNININKWSVFSHHEESDTIMA